MHITKNKYSLVAALGAAALASVLASCGGGSDSFSNALATGALTISGGVEQGQTLTATSTLADADGLGSFSYQWQADGLDIAGATGSTLVLGTAQVGKAVRVVVTYVDGRGNRESVISAATVQVVFATSNLQGIWTPGLVGVDAASMVVLSNGATWMLINHDPVQLIVSTLKGTATGYDGAGKQYTSGVMAAPVDVAFLTAVTQADVQTGSVTPAGEVARQYSFDYASRYQTPALLSDITGLWSGTRAAGAVAVNWNVSSVGVLTGSSTAGCTYDGTVGVHASNGVAVGVFDLTLIETCSNLGVTEIKDFAGIVTLSEDKTRASFAFTTESGNEGDAQAMTKAVP